ncbi:MAG: hypothetical protein HQK49_21500 [Oligoflexia bacterium]|nr:hypothetical protein [Oligoflexia bacterium]
MPRRSKDWNEGLAKDLRDSIFAKEFIMASIEDGISLQEVLCKIIHVVGIKEISKMTFLLAKIQMGF